MTTTVLTLIGGYRPNQYFKIMEINSELWKDIPGYEGIYQVSNFGNVKSLKRTVSNSRYGVQNKNERILKLCENTGKRYIVSLRNNSISKVCQVHVLVAMAFLGHKPCGHLLVIDHIDGNCKNNNLENIRIVTHRDNTTVCYRKGKFGFSSSYVGVCWDKSRGLWKSAIIINGKNCNLGRFTSEIDASNAYQNKLKTLK